MTEALAPHRWISSCGTRLTLRPVQPHDAPALARLFDGLSTRARRWRFHGGVKVASAAWIARLTQPGTARQQALVVVTDIGQVVAEARWARADDDGELAEFAIVVADAWQRLGIGQRLMRALAASADAAGVRWLQGEVLHDNGPMCRLMSGLSCRRRVPDDPGVAGSVITFELPVAQLLPPGGGLRDRVGRWGSQLMGKWAQLTLRIGSRLAV